MQFVVRLIKGWGVLLGVPALFVAAYIYPHIPVIGRIEVCAVKGFLRCDCPGCGIASSLWAIAHGNVRQSIDFHPMGVVVAGWFLYVFVRALIETVRGRPLPALLSQKASDILVYSFIAALVLQWIVKIWLSMS
jgi:hypothetical protein